MLTEEYGPQFAVCVFSFPPSLQLSKVFFSSSLGVGLARAELAGVPVLIGVVQVRGVVVSDSFLQKAQYY